MKPFLPVAFFCSLVIFACHKKTDSPTLPPDANYWKLTRGEFNGAVRVVWKPSADTTTRLDLLANNQFLIYTQYRQLSKGTYTLQISQPNNTSPAVYPDSIVKFNICPVLTADSSWLLLQEGTLRIYHGDSLVIASYILTPAGTSTFSFMRVAQPQ